MSMAHVNTLWSFANNQLWNEAIKNKHKILADYGQFREAFKKFVMLA